MVGKEDGTSDVVEGVTARETFTIVPVTGAIYHNGQEKPDNPGTPP